MVIKNKEGGAGIQFTKPPSQTAPPFAGREQEEEFKQPLPSREIPVEEKVIRAGKIPLHPAAVRLPFSIMGRIGTEMSGYEGFSFSESELNDLAELWIACGIMMSPILQASIATTAMIGGKFGGYYAWTRAGKPKLHKPGEAYERPKEEEE
ncbi:hypothetical protein KJ781_04485 [Patescibacteria group bacterium]|nr:hypothetical protein [Patescibacteria group bacterium]